MAEDAVIDQLDDQRRRLGPPMIAAPTATPGVLGVPPIGTPAPVPESLPGNRTMAGENMSATGVPMYKQGESVPATGTAPAINPHVAKAQQMEQEGSGVEQVQAKHPFWGGVLRGLDVAGTILSPRITQAIPGTTLHHNQLIAQQEGLANQDIAQQEHEAQTGEEQARIQALLHPPPKEEQEGKTVTTDEGVYQYNPQTHRYDVRVGDAKSSEPRGQVVQTESGPVMVMPGSTEGTPITVGGQPVSSPAEAKTPAAREKLADQYGLQGAERTHFILTGQIPQKFEFPGSGNEGTWQMAEDNNGNPVLFNSKTGETKAAPENLHPKGSYAKGAGAGDKALNYANEYLKSKTYTGPGDEALQEQFFSLAKPETGFRMTAPQIAQLQAGRSWMESLEGKAYHALHGVWFTDQQRHQIVQTMNDLAEANKAAHGGGTSAPASGGTGIKITRDANGRIISVE